MSELFRDLLHDRTVISAADRSKRPFDTRPSSLTDKPTEHDHLSTRRECPFCAGNESETPSEILAVRKTGSAKDSSNWQVRLVPNRYPAVTNAPADPTTATSDVVTSQSHSDPAQLSESVAHSSSTSLATAGMESISAQGEHDVLICCSTHRISSEKLSDDEWCNVLAIAQQRMQSWQAGNRWTWGTLFQNRGAAAGASLEHLHCQMLALPTVPTIPQQELESSAAYYFSHNRCYWCDEIAAVKNEISKSSSEGVATSSQSRLVIESEKHLAFCPLASRLPYEIWILPKRHNSQFELTAQEDLADLAKLLRSVLVKLEHLMPDVAYNWWLHSAPFSGAVTAANERDASFSSEPFDSSLANHYHWHIEVVPRVATVAGFEWCSGWHINSVPADRAAAALRKL